MQILAVVAAQLSKELIIARLAAAVAECKQCWMKTSFIHKDQQDFSELVYR